LTGRDTCMKTSKTPRDLPAKSPVNVKGGKLVCNDNMTLLRKTM